MRKIDMNSIYEDDIIPGKRHNQRFTETMSFLIVFRQ